MAEKKRKSKALTYYDIQLVRHIQWREIYGDDALVTPDDMYGVFEYLEHMDREHWVIAMLDTRRRLIGMHTASIGTLDMTVTSPREVFAPLILAKAHSWVMSHNHPSGDCSPSGADTKGTESFAGLSQVMGIPLLDHIIIGEGGSYYSYAEHNSAALKPSVQIGSRKVRPKARRRTG